MKCNKFMTVAQRAHSAHQGWVSYQGSACGATHLLSRQARISKVFDKWFCCRTIRGHGQRYPEDDQQETQQKIDPQQTARAMDGWTQKLGTDFLSLPIKPMSPVTIGRRQYSTLLPKKARMVMKLSLAFSSGPNAIPSDQNHWTGAVPRGRATLTHLLSVQRVKIAFS